MSERAAGIGIGIGIPMGMAGWYDMWVVGK